MGTWNFHPSKRKEISWYSSSIINDRSLQACLPPYRFKTFRVNYKVTRAGGGQTSVVNGTKVSLAETICHEREHDTKTRIERLFTSIRSRILDNSFICLTIDIDPLSLTMQDVPQIYRSKWDTCPSQEPLYITIHKTLFSISFLFFFFPSSSALWPSKTRIRCFVLRASSCNAAF